MGSTHHTTSTGGARRIAVAGAVVAAVVGLAACSGGDDDAASASTAAAALAPNAGSDDAATAGTVVADRAAAPPAAQLSTAGPTIAQTAGQSIAITAHTSVQADDVKAAVDSITTTVATHGGRIAAATIDYGPPATPDAPASSTATLVVEIPPTELDALRGALQQVGTVLSFDQQAEDVTDQLTDLDTRITNQRASIARIRELYASATDVESIVRIEGELTNRETALEQMLASQANLKDRVAMSTLTIDVATTPAAATVPDDGTSIGDALSAGWSAFAGAFFAIALVLTAAMPFLLLALAIGTVAYLLLKTSRNAKKAQSARRSATEPLQETQPLRSEESASHPG